MLALCALSLAATPALGDPFGSPKPAVEDGPLTVRDSTPELRRRLQTIQVTPISCGGSASGTTVGLPDTLGQPGGEAWFSFTATSTGGATWSSCNSGFDTFMRVLDASVTLPSVNQLAYCDDGGGAAGAASLTCTGCSNSRYQAQLTFRMQAGESYYLLIEGYNGEGNFNVQLACATYQSPPPSPPLPPSVPRCTVDLDLVLVLDRSGSMNTGTVVVDVRALGLSLIDQFELTPGLARIGVVEFASSASTVQDLTSTRCAAASPPLPRSTAPLVKPLLSSRRTDLPPWKGVSRLPPFPPPAFDCAFPVNACDAPPPTAARTLHSSQQARSRRDQPIQLASRQHQHGCRLAPSQSAHRCWR